MWSVTGSPGRQLRIVGVIALLAASSVALARGPSGWDGLAESASLRIGTSARQLAQSAGAVGGAGRVGNLALMRSDAEDLVRRTDTFVQLAQEPLPEEAEAAPKASEPIPGKRRPPR